MGLAGAPSTLIHSFLTVGTILHPSCIWTYGLHMAGYAGVSGSVRLTPQNWLNQRKSRNTATNKHTNALYIYYYTPLPLNLANKQQATTTTTRHHSVLATAPSHRLGLDSTLAILEPRWWPCQIQVLSQKLTGGGPGRGRQVGRCPPKSAQFWAKNSHFSPKTALVRAQSSQTKANGCYTPPAACLSRDQWTFGAL